MSIDLLDRLGSSEALSDWQWTLGGARCGVLQRSFRAYDIASMSGPVMVPFSDGFLVFSEQPPNWFRELLERICALGNLPENWDSYGARQIDPQCALAAVTLLLSIMNPRIPPPSVVPTVRGGIQLEWHRGGLDLEIRVESPSRFHVVFEDEQTEQQWEEMITSDLRPLVALLEQLSTKD